LNQGFTILELVLVILILGVMATAVAPRWTGSSQTLQYEARRVLDDIRYAQAMSLASGERYRWVRTSANTYQITNQAGSAIKLAHGSTTVTLTNGATFGVFTNLPNSLLAFDSQGAPYTTSSLPGTALASTATIPLSNSTTTQTITITPTTGYGALT
jgi:type II secretion system protein H